MCRALSNLENPPDVAGVEGVHILEGNEQSWLGPGAGRCEINGHRSDASAAPVGKLHIDCGCGESGDQMRRVFSVVGGKSGRIQGRAADGVCVGPGTDCGDDCFDRIDAAQTLWRGWLRKAH